MAYFSNGSEVLFLDEQCSECLINDDDPCPILLVQLEFNYVQVNKGNEKLREAMNILIGKDGVCRMKPLLDCAGKVNPNKKCFQRPLVFGDENQMRELNKV
jgi:hypothetical protein